MEALATWLVGVIHTLGYPGVFLGMFLGNALVPIPVELVMIPAGYLVQKGQMHPLLLLCSGVAGDIFGSLFAYYIAFHVGRRVLLAYGKYVFLDEKHLAKFESFFAKHGEISTLTGRLIPGLRHFMAFPAGLSHMNVKKFVAYTGVGGGIWMTVLILVGYFIGDNEKMIKHYLSFITGAVVGGLAVVIVLYMLHHRKKNTGEMNGNP